MKGRQVLPYRILKSGGTRGYGCAEDASIRGALAGAAMMNHDEEVHERHRDELQDRRERGGAQGELGGEGESAEWRAALGEHGSTEHLLALKVDAMEVTVVTEPTQLGHVVLALVETRTGRGRSSLLRLSPNPACVRPARRTRPREGAFDRAREREHHPSNGCAARAAADVVG